MKSISEYKYVYENWYCKSCEKSNETPVSFATYLRIMPVNEIEVLKQFLSDEEIILIINKKEENADENL